MLTLRGCFYICFSGSFSLAISAFPTHFCRKQREVERKTLKARSQHINWTDMNKSTQLHQELIGHVHSPARQRHDLLFTDWQQTLQRTMSLTSEHVYSPRILQFSSHVLWTGLKGTNTY